MPRRSLASFIVAGLVFGFAVPASTAEETVDTSRLVTVGGPLTEIVFALGEEARLVGRDTTSVAPPAALELPDVGYIRRLSAEGVLSINPTAILALEGSGPKEVVDVLQKASVPFITVPESYDSAGIINKIRITGDVLGVPEKARDLIEDVAADLEAAEASTAGMDAPKRKVMFILSLQGGRVMASGKNTAADGIITMAGGANVIDSFEGYKPLSDEAVIKAAPDVILMMDRGGEHGPANAELFRHPAIAATPAGTNESVIRMDGAYILGFGPRTASAIRDLSAFLRAVKAN